MTIIEAPTASSTHVQIPKKPGRRIAAALLIIGPVLMLLSALTPAANNAVNAAANPRAADWANFIQILSVIFMLGWAAVLFLTTRRTSPVAATVAFVAMVCQLVALAAVTGAQIMAMVLATGGMSPAQIDQTFSDGLGHVSMVGTFILFMPTLIVGLMAWSIALWKSDWAPRPAAILMLVVLVADVVLPSDPAFFHVGVFGLVIVASCLLASAILRNGASVSLDLSEDVGQ